MRSAGQESMYMIRPESSAQHCSRILTVLPHIERKYDTGPRPQWILLGQDALLDWQ